MSNHPLLNIAIQAARKAGNTLIRALNRPELAAETESETAHDIIKAIQKLYPDHSFLSAPFGFQQNKSPDESIWLIDSVNGKANFLHGLPHFCVSIAIQQKGQLEHAAIYDPIRQEIFTASRGQGGKLEKYRLRVSTCADVQTALIRSSGCPGLDLAYVAANRLDGFRETGLKPWEIAAGLLLVTEAGGILSEPNGSNHYLTSGNILAANPKLIGVLQHDQT